MKKYCSRKAFCSHKIDGKCDQSDSKCEFQHNEKFVPRNFYNMALERTDCKIKHFSKKEDENV